MSSYSPKIRVFGNTWTLGVMLLDVCFLNLFSATRLLWPVALSRPQGWGFWNSRLSGGSFRKCLSEGESEMSGGRGSHPVQPEGPVAGRARSRRANRVSSSSPQPDRALFSGLRIVVRLEPSFSRKWNQGRKAQAPVIRTTSHFVCQQDPSYHRHVTHMESW